MTGGIIRVTVDAPLSDLNALPGVVDAEQRGAVAVLRCDDSDATLARDIRVLIRERISAGESKAQVKDFLVSRYGDFILLKPPFKPDTLLLWLSPVLTLGLGVAAALYASRRAPTETAT